MEQVGGKEQCEYYQQDIQGNASLCGLMDMGRTKERDAINFGFPHHLGTPIAQRAREALARGIAK